MESANKRFAIKDAFFSPLEEKIRTVVLPYQEAVLKDEVEGVAKSHAVENFRAAAEVLKNGKCDTEFYGMVFQDSDVAKWLEAAAYSLQLTPDAELEEHCDRMIDIVAEAQHEDGYLNTYFTVKEPGRRWTDLSECHELYCAGHMIEAAVAYADATGKTKLLDVMCRFADHIYNHFITEGNPGFPGHEEIELALLRLYRKTGEERYKELSAHFLNARGDAGAYFQKESRERGWYLWGKDPAAPEYNQTHLPVREQKDAVGHAVRAVYLYTGMADLAAETGDESLKQACRNLYESITKKRMYLTGGIGSAYEGEAFTEDYHLPNESAYAETCAAVGFCFFLRQMLRLEKKGEYADTMERALYNGVLGGMQLDGKRFFYVNPLEAIPGVSGVAAPLKHALPERPGWFACACCPPNVARLIGSVAEYAYSIEDGALYQHLYLGGTIDMEQEFGGKITVECDYPKTGHILYTFSPTTEKVMDVRLAIRIPSYAKKTTILRNGSPYVPNLDDGYAYIEGKFRAGDTLILDIDMSARRVYANQHVAADTGKIAFLRGPLVYCAEGTDNDGDVLGLRVSRTAPIREIEGGAPDGMPMLTVSGSRITTGEELYSFDAPEKEPVSLRLIPYYTWGNRGLSEMRVWIPKE